MVSRHLTKSRYMAGLQCLRRLWLQVHEPHDYEAPPPGSPLDFGQEIGQKAHLLFPGGILIDEEPWQHEQAVERTAALMLEPTVPAIFEAAFVHDNVRVRVDVLERRADGWGLLEVKSSSRVKDHYLNDIALQAHVLTGAGVPLSTVELLHINTSYTRGDGEIDWPAFFARVNVAEKVTRRCADLPGRLPGLHTCLEQDTAPHVEPGNHCGDPYECEFWDRCTADKPTDWIAHLPYLTPPRARALDALGVTAISAIPRDFPLTWKQEIIRDAIASGRPYVAADLPSLLHRFGPPACYLDFEAMMPPIPLYAGTRPYQALPFQWSLHMMTAEGALTHKEFLAPADGDPRRPFAETLIAALAGSDTPIVVYSSYEQIRLKELAGQFPDLGPSLTAIIERLVDLLPVIRGAVYFPAFGFSNSIKSVAPALSPGFGYDDLEGVADGTSAAGIFLELASGKIADTTDVTRFRSALVAYCTRDTMAMVEVHRALMTLSTETETAARTNTSGSDAAHDLY
ncbi:MAG TPA: hypothetical protein DDZ81_00660 [Acetobacteraceae bacterium]|jgi:hypothetical protein|nr:hypothetical protein [Acetobacteraceae bacterium]